MKADLGLETTIATGRTGDFEVTLNGKKVFSKAETGRFPEPGEVEEAIKKMLGNTA